MGNKSNRPHITPIHVLGDDLLLDIFYLYRPFFLGEDEDDFNRLYGGRERWNQGRWWYRLAHVCQRWRSLILGSASYLRLSLVCTNGTPIESMLAHLPALPLTIDYGGERDITAEDEHAILLALEQRHRVRHLRLALPVLYLQRLVMAINGEFPILEYLIVYPTKISTVLTLPETLRAPQLRHIMLGAFTRPIRPRLHPTTESLVSLFLIINHQSAYFQPNVLLQWISSMPQLENLAITFTFPVPDHVERELVHTPITTHITHPNLRLFLFGGISAYLEAVVCRITTPRLEKLGIRLFRKRTFSLPGLVQFMNTTENFRFHNAQIRFKDNEVNVEVFLREADTYSFSVTIDCWDWQVSSAAQISNALSQVFSPVEQLTLEQSRSSKDHNYVDQIEWRNLLRPFSNVKTLGVGDGLVEDLFRCLQLEDGEPPLGLIPKLQELIYSARRDAGDAFTSFIDARQSAGRAVTLVRHNPIPIPTPIPVPSPVSFARPPTITSPSDGAQSNIET